MRSLRLPPASERYDRRIMDKVLAAIQEHSLETDTAIQRRYTVSGGIVTTGTLTSSDAVLALLVADMKVKGLLR